jgi:hypothetical protein
VLSTEGQQKHKDVYCYNFYSQAGVLSIGIMQVNEIKGSQFRNKKVKVSQFANDMILNAKMILVETVPSIRGKEIKGSCRRR